MVKKMILLCGRCKCKPELVNRKGRNNLIRCPKCGKSGDEIKVLGDASVHRAKILSNKEIRKHQRTMKAGGVRSKFVTYESGKIQDPSTPPFIFQ